MPSNRPSLLYLLVFGLPLLIFSGVLQNEFLTWDDHTLIFHNPHYQSSAAPNIASFWRGPYEKLYMPLTYTLWGGLSLVARLETPQWTSVGPAYFNPLVFHGANWLLHAFNVVLVFALLRRLKFSELAAVGGAFCWGLHPLQVESVAWASELKGVLCAFWVFNALLFYVKYAQAPIDSKQWQPHALALICFVLALLSKPSAVAMPLMALALDGFLLRRHWRQSFLSLAPFFVLALGWVWLTRRAQPIEAPLWSPLLYRPLITGDVLAFYLGKFLLPWPLTADYGRTPRFVMEHWWSYVTWMVPFAVLLLVIRSREKTLMAALGVFVGAALPNSGLVPFAFQNFSTVADRYAYLPLLGLALAFAWLLQQVNAKRPRAALGLSVVASLLWASMSLWQGFYWANDVALSTHVLEVNPRSFLGHVALGNAAGATERYDEAMAHFRAAQPLAPPTQDVRFNMAQLLLRQGRDEEAVRMLREAVADHPHLVVAHFNLANALMQQKRFAEAIQWYESALQIQPDYAPARKNLLEARQRETRR
jgi:hypothetical protein